MVELSFSFHDFMVIPLMSELRGRPVHSQKLTSSPYLSVIQVNPVRVRYLLSVHHMETEDEEHTVSSVLFDHAAPVS